MKPYLALIAALGLAGCMKDGGTNMDADLQPGQIQLVQGLNKTALTDSSAKYIFNLDTVKTSAEHEFILQNTGDYDVKNVRLVTNNPHFYFSPSEIPVLSSSKKSLILQVIKLKVVHGSRLDGIGYDSLLPMGNNTANVQITATTSNARHDTINLSQTARLNVFAQVMDIAAYVNDTTALNLFSTQTSSTLASALNDYPRFQAKGTIKVVNIGNVTFKMRLWRGSVYPPIDSFVVIPGGIARLPDTRSSNGIGLTIELDGQGVTCNPFKFAPSSNGKAYMEFSGNY